ncbi:MAG: hypothetical protein FJ125_14390, partial [Deltaproteobacteria bacterium]|nr:hypothetical protein [Deltaproteobacteria bacterium]
MYGKLRYLLQEFALASDVSQRKRLLEQLHGELGLQMRQVLLAWRVPHLDHEDVVQDRVLDVARALLQQRVADDRLDAFVYACSA